MKEKVIFYLKFFFEWLKQNKKKKYAIIFFSLGLYMFFFDNYNWLDRLKKNIEIRQLESEITKYQEEYKESTKGLKELEKSKNAMRNFARKRYFMKKENEDVFVFKEDLEKDN